MGIFDFLKGKKRGKPSLDQDIKTASEWIASALNSSGYKMDFTLQSLKEIDRFFADNMDDASHKPKEEGLLSKSMGQRLFAIGSYIGEVIIKEFGGEWLTDDNEKSGELNISVKLPNGNIVMPVLRTIKRCKEGPENDIYGYAVLCGRE